MTNKRSFIRQATLFIALFFLYRTASSQILIFRDSVSIASYKYFRGQIVQIATDSVFILNNITHDKYQAALQDKDTLTKAANFLRDIINVYKTDSAQSNGRYTDLMHWFDSVSTEAKKFNAKTEINLNGLDKSLTEASAKAAHINQLIDEAMTDTKRIRRHKLGWMIGGFSVGVGAASLVYLITR